MVIDYIIIHVKNRRILNDVGYKAKAKISTERNSILEENQRKKPAPVWTEGKIKINNGFRRSYAETFQSEEWSQKYLHSAKNEWVVIPKPHDIIRAP